MARVTPDDVILTAWKGSDPSTIALIQPGNADPSGKVLVSGAAHLTCPWIYALAAVTLRGSPGEDVSFWRFGFIQLKFITDDWAHYRGDAEADGSVFLAWTGRRRGPSSFAGIRWPKGACSGRSRDSRSWARSSFMIRKRR